MITMHEIRSPHLHAIRVEKLPSSTYSPHARDDAPTSERPWLVYVYPYQRTYYATPADAMAYVRAKLVQATAAAGRAATKEQWDDLCEQQRLIAREHRTARDLLALPRGRLLLTELGTRSHSTDLDYYATRSVQREAAAILSERVLRRAARSVADAARIGSHRRIAKLLPVYRQRREDAAKVRADKRLAKALAGERVGRKQIDELISRYRDQVSTGADQFVRCVVRAVGKIGEQCRADLAMLETGESFTGKKSRNHHLVKTTLERVEHLADWSAALITMRTFEQFGSRHWGNGSRDYGSRGGNRYECWLAVRDSSTGEAHLLRVPPKFGNSSTQFFGKFRSSRERIKAAVAWTFDMEPAAYRPQVTA